jgi:hypothetical protein
MRAISASAPGVRPLPGKRLRTFIHIARRSSAKPACISAEIDSAQGARVGSAGHRSAGTCSAR